MRVQLLLVHMYGDQLLMTFIARVLSLWVWTTSIVPLLVGAKLLEPMWSQGVTEDHFGVETAVSLVAEQCAHEGLSTFAPLFQSQNLVFVFDVCLLPGSLIFSDMSWKMSLLSRNIFGFYWSLLLGGICERFLDKLFSLGDVFQAPFKCQGTGDVHHMDGLVGVVCFPLLCT